MRGSSLSLARLAASGESVQIAIILYHDTTERTALIETLAAFAGADVAIVRAKSVDSAFENLDSIVVLELPPEDEAAAVGALSLRRGSLEKRKRPAILFVIEGGSALDALPENPPLASWVQDWIIDPNELDSVDHVALRSKFERDTGRTPEDWLRDYRAGILPDTVEIHVLAHRAQLVEE